METAIERRADLVLVQEPPEFRGYSHPGFDYLRAGRVMTARRKDSEWTVYRGRLCKGSGGRHPGPGPWTERAQREGG